LALEYQHAKQVAQAKIPLLSTPYVAAVYQAFGLSKSSILSCTTQAMLRVTP
jgi:hypothetical protein